MKPEPVASASPLGASPLGVAEASHLAAIVESSDDAILSKDRDAIITSWNPAAERLYGYSAEEAIGKPIAMLIPPERAGEERTILERILRDERVEHYETERVRRDGGRVFLSLTASPLRNADGEIAGASVIARDITAQRQATERDARLQRIATALSSAIEPEESLAAALREARAALGADAGAVGLLDEDGETVRVVADSGYSPDAIERWRTFQVGAPLPMADVIRTGVAVWGGGERDLIERYPELTDRRIDFAALAIAPLVVRGVVFGAVSLSFREPREFSPQERGFLLAAVQQTAYALERARLHEAERRARRHLEFLARASELLASSLDVEATLGRLADLVVPRIADWCSIDLLDEDGQLQTVAVAHPDPRKIAAARELRRRLAPDPGSPVGAAAAVRTGRTQFHPTVSEQLLERAADDEEAQRTVRELGLRSAIVVPLRARDRPLGALTLVAAESQRRFDDDDVEIAEDLARRASLAIENALLYRQEHGAVVTLQRSLIPRELPAVPGIGLAARYLPAGAGVEVGGDWYDAIALEGGRFDVLIGDVAGRGIRAASVMGQLRTALRAYLLDGHAPVEAVERLNTLTRTFEGSEMATLLLLSLDTRRRQLEGVRAGHPPPLVRRPGGQVDELEIAGSLPIGVARPAYRSTVVEVEPGSLILAYTDGLVERRKAGIQPGLERLKRVLERAPAEPEACLDFVLETLRPDEVDDDVALVALSIEELAQRPFHVDLPADPAELAGLRRALEDWLASQDVGEAVAWEIVAACHEACANAAEHAYPPSETGSIEVDATREGARLVVTVADRGRWRPPRGRYRGRGSALMEHLMDSVEVDRSPAGTTVRMERALVPEGA